LQQFVWHAGTVRLLPIRAQGLPTISIKLNNKKNNNQEAALDSRLKSSLLLLVSTRRIFGRLVLGNLFLPNTSAVISPSATISIAKWKNHWI
jgi:hypothetical protein